MKTPYIIKTFYSALVNLLNPLGLVFILGSFYFQYSYNDYNADIEDLRKEVLNIRLDNVAKRMEGNSASVVNLTKVDTTLTIVEQQQTPAYLPVEDLKRVEKRIEEVSRRLQEPNLKYLWFYVLGSLCIIIDAFHKAFKK